MQKLKCKPEKNVCNHPGNGFPAAESTHGSGYSSIALGIRQPTARCPSMEVPTPEKKEGGLKTHSLQHRESREQQETPTLHQKKRNSPPISSSLGVISERYNNLIVLPVTVTQTDLLSLCTPPIRLSVLSVVSPLTIVS